MAYFFYYAVYELVSRYKIKNYSYSETNLKQKNYMLFNNNIT